MSTLKVNGIRHSSASSDAITLASDGTCTAKITNNLSNRNLIINGACNVAQRGSATATIGYASVDRFTIAQSGGDNLPDQAQRALTSSDTGPWAKGFRNCFKMTNGNQSTADAADYSIIYYKIEAQDLASSGWDYTNTSSKVSFSFWVKSSVAQNFYFDFMTNDGTGQGYCMETGSLSANTWTKITKTIPGSSNLQFDNNSGAGIEIGFNVYYGSDYTDAGRALNTWAAWAGGTRTPVYTAAMDDWWLTNDATFELTGVQLEVGEVVTDFEHRSYADELLRCQRYCWVQGEGTWATLAQGTIASSTTWEGQARMPVTMRSKPSATVSGNTRVWDAGGATAASATGVDSGASTKDQIWHTATCSGASFTTGRSSLWGANNDATAKVTYEAEI